MEEAEKVSLSVVIICKNEERFIGGCIKSVLKATSGIEAKEILVVDSSSTDRTIDTASQYPVKIYQLRPEWRHTPAAGRYIGFKKSSGDYILFMDGDSFLVEGFLERAFESFNSQMNIAGIIGRRNEIYYEEERVVGEKRDFTEIGEEAKPVFTTGGNTIYRRSALDEVGGFNPYLFSEEEAELSDRLKRGGYIIMGIPYDMVIHNTLQREKVKTLFQRVKSNLHLGPGQIMRYGLRNGISSELFKTVNYGFRFLGWVMIGGAASILSLIFRSWNFILIWMCLSVLLFVAFGVKSKSFSKPFRYSLIWSVESYSAIRGFLLQPMDPESYPTDAIVVK